jgi:hypothetical protein
MKLNISFEERAKLSAVILAKQPLVTLKEARKQAQWLKGKSIKRRGKEIKNKITYYKPVTLAGLKNDANLGFYFE